MALHNETGKAGEQAAVQFLLKKGYEILDENWVFGKAEVDIIALHSNTIIFIEVKTRSSVAFGMPEDFVSAAKRRQLELASQAYIEIMEHQGEIRFDVIAVLLTKNKQFEIHHIEDAFWPYA
jgi:putative endonuclease